jgi:hypothetical protein
MLAKMTAKAPTIYIKAIIGTILEVTAAILVIPPNITKAKKTPSTLPIISGSKPNVASILVAILLLCGRLPVPNELITVAMAKATANHFMFKRLSI